MNRKDFELMAPVGSYESLHAAIDAGADAVYFGVEGLNMRAKSSANFTLDDLRSIAETCAEAGVKTYLTVNTIIYDDELEVCRRICRAAREAGISAVIASDIAAISIARSEGVEVHISTQCNISNIEAVRFYAQYADVVVLARELNMEQVRAIHDAIVADDIRGPHGGLVRLEMFCHGALCMAVSGKCYLSLHQMNSSANRGSCTQICRRGYRVTDLETSEELEVENKYIMSPKDLCTIHFLDRMVEAGVSVFKIEGRARGPEYVRVAVEAYSDALDAVCRGADAYTQERIGEWSAKYGSSATRVKHYVAKGVKWYSRLGVGEFLMEAGELCVGDEVVVTGPTTGALIFKVEDIRVDLKSVQKAVKGDAFSIPVPAKIRPADRLYRWEDTKIAHGDAKA